MKNDFSVTSEANVLNALKTICKSVQLKELPDFDSVSIKNNYVEAVQVVNDWQRNLVTSSKESTTTISVKNCEIADDVT